MSPTFDSDGYPTDETLNAIRAWPENDLNGLIDFLRICFEGYGRVWLPSPHHFALATGGWSGNEEIIGALQENHVFWMTYWESSHRGGKYVFKFRPDSNYVLRPLMNPNKIQRIR